MNEQLPSEISLNPQPEIKNETTKTLSFGRQIVFTIVCVVSWLLVLGFLILISALANAHEQEAIGIFGSIILFVAGLGIMSLMTRKAFIKKDIMPLIGAIPLVFVSSMITIVILGLITGSFLG